MEPGFSRVLYMQTVSKWMLLWGWGAIIMLGRVGWTITMGHGWKWQLPIAIFFASWLGVPLWRIWRLWKKLLIVWAEDDARQQKAREAKADLDRRQRDVELLEREKEVREERERLEREREAAIADIEAMQDELEGELRER